MASLLLGFGLVLRSGLKGHSSLQGRLLEFFSDLLPVMLALASLQIALSNGWATLSPVIAALAFLMAWFLIPGVFSQSLDFQHLRNWGMARQNCRVQVLGVAALAAVGAADLSLMTTSGLASPMGLLASISMWVALYSLASGANLAREAVEAEVQRSQTEDDQLEVEHRQTRVQQVERTQEKTNKNLELRMETFSLIHRLLQTLPNEPALKAVAHGIIEQVRIKIPCSSVVLFWEEDGRLQPMASITPHIVKLQQSVLTHDVEPVVDRAWRTSQPQRLRPDDLQKSRIFVDENKAAAVPFRGKGALYIGDSPGSWRSIGTGPGATSSNPTKAAGDFPELEVPTAQDAYTDEQLEFLESLAEQGRLALDAAYFQQKQAEALASEASSRANLQATLERLNLLLEGLAAITQLQDPVKILGATADLVARLVVCHAVYLDFGPQQIGQPLLKPESQQSLTTVLKENKKTVSFEDLSKSRFEAIRPELKSLMAVPVFSQETFLGLILLGANSTSAFQRIDLDVIQVLSYELGGTIQSAQLFSQLNETHRRLKESQAQLVQSSKMAAVGQLAGGVAHELNTPLGAIAVGIDSALMNIRKQPDRSEVRLQKALVSVDQMTSIVSKLLFYSREATFERQETDLNQVVQDTLELLGHQLHLDNIVLSTKLSEIPTTYANQNELQQILTNLLLNAKDAVLSPGALEPKIEISTVQQGESLLLTVSDWGTGISPELAERIFEPFFTTKEVGRGTGLGLSVTSQLVQQHRGQIRVEKNLPQGCRFVVQLPITLCKNLEESDE